MKEAELEYLRRIYGVKSIEGFADSFPEDADRMKEEYLKIRNDGKATLMLEGDPKAVPFFPRSYFGGFRLPPGTEPGGKNLQDLIKSRRWHNKALSFLRKLFNLNGL